MAGAVPAKCALTCHLCIDGSISLGNTIYRLRRAPEMVLTYELCTGTSGASNREYEYLSNIGVRNVVSTAISTRIVNSC